jgi:hypothetical protein
MNLNEKYLDENLRQVLALQTAVKEVQMLGDAVHAEAI